MIKKQSKQRPKPKPKYPIEKVKYIQLPYYLIESEAFNELNMACIRILHCLYAHLTWENMNPKKKGKPQWVATNNGDISVATATIMKECDIRSKQSVVDNRNKLIECGFIELTQVGTYKIAHLYKLNLPTLVSSDEMKWKYYPKQNWKEDIPRSQGNLLGAKTRFKSKTSPKELDQSKSKNIDYNNGISLRN
tara:strand:+ start:1197 stop:1772 length:576 start_codon:yes stop_codon:yes gene_type:complete